MNGFGVYQAERSAKTVAERPTKATGESVACQAVLTFPGWWVEVEGRGAVVVAATKGLHRVLVKCGGPLLPSERIQRIAYQFEQRCRQSEKV